MMMPWRCFVCGGVEVNCGHREPELIVWADKLRLDQPRREDRPQSFTVRVPKKYTTKRTGLDRQRIASQPQQQQPPRAAVPPSRSTRIAEYSALRGY
jgi:hypothetical protein